LDGLTPAGVCTMLHVMDPTDPTPPDPQGLIIWADRTDAGAAVAAGLAENVRTVPIHVAAALLAGLDGQTPLPIIQRRLTRWAALLAPQDLPAWRTEVGIVQSALDLYADHEPAEWPLDVDEWFAVGGAGLATHRDDAVEMAAHLYVDRIDMSNIRGIADLVTVADPEVSGDMVLAASMMPDAGKPHMRGALETLAATGRPLHADAIIAAAVGIARGIEMASRDDE
jgi:hypothetical protein